MTPSDKRSAYYSLIGEFIHLCAEIELCVTQFVVLKKDSEWQLAGTAVVIKIEEKMADGFYKKVETIDSIISFNGDQTTKSKELSAMWLKIREEMIDIMNNRHFIVHGTGLSFFFDEPVKTFIVEYQKKGLTKREFSINDIQILISRSRMLLYGTDGLQNKFWHSYGYWITGKPIFLTSFRVFEE